MAQQGQVNVPQDHRQKGPPQDTAMQPLNERQSDLWMPVVQSGEIRAVPTPQEAARIHPHGTTVRVGSTQQGEIRVVHAQQREVEGNVWSASSQKAPCWVKSIAYTQERDSCGGYTA